jgi:hypothetical protein
MHPKPLSADTSPDVERLLIERWRRMTPAQKLAKAVAASESVRDLARAGIRQRHPGADEHEQFLRFAVLTLGRDLARLVLPESAGLEP